MGVGGWVSVCVSECVCVRERESVCECEVEKGEEKGI